jgi:ribonuclease P protein component
MPRPAISRILDEAYKRGSTRIHTQALTGLIPAKSRVLNKSVVIAGLKISKNAADRNRLKRRIRSLLLKTPPSKALVILPKPMAKDLSFAELRANYISLIGKLNAPRPRS